MAKERERAPRTLVVGVGSESRADDSVGLHVARRLAAGGLRSGWSVLELSGGWLPLIDHLDGIETMIVVDACDIGAAPGSVIVFDPGEVAAWSRSSPISGHAVAFGAVLDLARALHGQLPSRVFLVGIQVADVVTFAASLSPAVEASVPRACGVVLDLGALGPDGRRA